MNRFDADSSNGPRGSGEAPRVTLRGELCVALLLVVGATLFYLPSADGEFLYDDRSMILAQEPPRSLKEMLVSVDAMSAGLPYYRPVTWCSLLLQKRLHGTRPAPFHVMNASLIGILAGVTYLLLREPSFGIPRLAAALATALYVVHPAVSSCVYPIASGRETLLPTLLCVAAVAAFLRRGRVSYTVCLTFLLLALFAKESAIVVPLIFLTADLLDLTRRGRPASAGRWIVRYAPVVVVTVFYLGVRWAKFEGAELDLAVASDTLAPLRSFAYAVQTAFAPFAELRYEPPLETWWSTPRLIAGLACLALLLVPCVQRAERRVLLFWLVWVVAMLLPTANILRQETAFDERYVAAALVGGIAVVALSVSSIKSLRIRTAGLTGLAVLVGTAGFLSWQRQYVFANEVAFYRQWALSSPAAARPRHNMANRLLELGNSADAEAWFRSAIHADSEFLPAYSDLASVVWVQGRFAEAEALYQELVRRDSDHAVAHLNLAEFAFLREDLAGAISHYQSAIASRPDWALAHNNLGCALEESGELSQAASELETAVRLDPAFAPAYFNLARVVAVQGDVVRARELLTAAMRLVPADSAEARDIQQAMAELRDADGSRP